MREEGRGWGGVGSNNSYSIRQEGERTVLEREGQKQEGKNQSNDSALKYNS